MALRDPLTQLPTEELFHDRLAQAVALARRKRWRAAVVQLALDGVGPLEAQPELLVALARRLEQGLRATDTVSRVGGHDFTILLNDVDSRPAARAVAEELLITLGKPLEIGGRRIEPRGRYGLAVFPDEGETADEVLARAGEALRQTGAP